MSGGMDLQGSFGEATLESVSGGISIKSSVVPSSLKAETMSGGITVAVPDEGPVTVSHSSVSGKLSSDLPIVMQGKDAQFRLSTVSGRVRIEKYT
jgi:DUF4097 and DUF4098 domain-containing protein YvlB